MKYNCKVIQDLLPLYTAVFRANGVGRRGGDQRQGEGGEKPGLIHLIVSHRDSGVPGQREGYTLVYSPVGVRIK